MDGEIRRTPAAEVDTGFKDENDEPILKWTRSLTEIKCCGEWLPCSGFTNTCQHCEADYNMGAQRLASRSQWGEETGESVDDILSVDDHGGYNGYGE